MPYIRRNELLQFVRDGPGGINFDRGRDDIQRAGTNKPREISNHLNQNPSSRVAINGEEARSVTAVSEALLRTGVPASRMQTGGYSDPQRRDERRVDVTVSN